MITLIHIFCMICSNSHQLLYDLYPLTPTFIWFLAPTPVLYDSVYDTYHITKFIYIIYNIHSITHPF